MRISRSSSLSTVCIRDILITIPELPPIITRSPTLIGRAIAIKSPANALPITVWLCKASDQTCETAHSQRRGRVAGQNGNHNGHYYPIRHDAHNDSECPSNIWRCAPLSNCQKCFASILYRRNSKEHKQANDNIVPIWCKEAERVILFYPGREHQEANKGNDRCPRQNRAQATEGVGLD